MNEPSKRKYTFDLELAIATWRQFLSRERSVSDDDLEELEIHLRDEFKDLGQRVILVDFNIEDNLASKNKNLSTKVIYLYAVEVNGVTTPWMDQ